MLRHMQAMALPSPEKLLMVYEDAKRIEAVERRTRETRHRIFVEMQTPREAATILEKAMKAAEAGEDHHVHEIYDDELRAAVMHFLRAGGYTVAEVVVGPSWKTRQKSLRIDFGPVEEKPKKRSWWRLGM